MTWPCSPSPLAKSSPNACPANVEIHPPILTNPHGGANRKSTSWWVRLDRIGNKEMRQIQKVLILSLLLGFPLLLLDQVNDSDWLRFQESLVIQTEHDAPCIEKQLWMVFKPLLSFNHPTGFVFLKNDFLSVLSLFLHDAIPFCRPPPET